MMQKLGRSTIFGIAILFLSLTFFLAENSALGEGAGPSTPQALAAQYMAAFNKKDMAGLKKLYVPGSPKSPIQEMMDQMTEAEMGAGTQYSKFEVLPAAPEMSKPMPGPDGKVYAPDIAPTNQIKVTAVLKGGSTSTSFPIGKKNGIFYIVSAVPTGGAPLAFKFGWQRFQAPGAHWSVMMPNEPEPGRAAVEKGLEKGKTMNDPDAYGVVKNTADIKTTEHIFICAAEGKRISDKDNNSTYLASCTTYAPETLSKWFADVKKNLLDAVDFEQRANSGNFVEVENINLNGAPGNAFKMKTKDGYVVGRVYWIKDALYKLRLSTHGTQIDEPSAKKFLDSLEVN